MKTIGATLNKRERETLMLAISIAIEHGNRALELCCQRVRTGLFGLTDAIIERKRTLEELQWLRERLLELHDP